ncbi:MAG: hypothetical protein CMN97_06125 [Synechococcus sp. NAT40]|uniref:hypothetical protein n=1 Tax=Synechococcus sp. MIT S9451 TaxID=3082543 RepID=UPI000C8E52E3|nr:hypothetical protein [Synechococcus sp. NAT40]
MTAAALGYRIVRDDGEHDSVTRLSFSDYDEAYDELERFYAATCCSDDRIEYSIIKIKSPVSDS